MISEKATHVCDLDYSVEIKFIGFLKLRNSIQYVLGSQYLVTPCYLFIYLPRVNTLVLDMVTLYNMVYHHETYILVFVHGNTSKAIYYGA